MGTSDSSSTILYFAKFTPVALGSLPISWSTLILIVFKVCLKLWSNNITTSGGNSLWVLITFYQLFLRAKNAHRLSNIWYLHVISCLNFMMTDVTSEWGGQHSQPPKETIFSMWNAYQSVTWIILFIIAVSVCPVLSMTTWCLYISVTMVLYQSCHWRNCSH